MASKPSPNPSEEPYMDLHAAEPDHTRFMQHALDEARKCSPSLSAFSVGAVLVDPSIAKIIATGFSREHDGNTHAEEVCLAKFDEWALTHTPTSKYFLYTTMEPCTKRLSGKMSCLDRIINFGRITTVYVGCREPSTFIAGNASATRLPEANIGYVSVDILSAECLETARVGHAQ